jgi:uncharacterized membrane protein YccF (DUF307 family)
MEKYYSIGTYCVVCSQIHTKTTPLTLTVHSLKTIKTVEIDGKIKKVKGLHPFEIWLCKDHIQTSTKTIQNILGNPINLNNL